MRLIIPNLQMKPLLKRNIPKPIIFPTLGVRGRLILGRKINKCPRQGSSLACFKLMCFKYLFNTY